MADPAGFGVYIHWPFCRARCPYCDFNAHVRDGIDQAAWRAALLAELDHASSLTQRSEGGSVFFGGGTPSLMEPATVAALLARIREHWAVADDLEVTLEANPTSAEAENFAGYRAAGVNRLSIGLQALDPAALRFLGRGHTPEEALAAVGMAAAIFPRFSFDLIYGRPGQTVAGWLDELEAALAHAAGHISLYQLTIEKGTPFHAAEKRGAFAMPDEALAAELFEVTRERLEAAGLAAYEISNHARPGEQCRHNLLYWNYGEYAGIGPGAHGRLRDAEGDVLATETRYQPEAWLQAVRADGHATLRTAELSPAQAMGEAVMMGLRLDAGLARAPFETRFGLDVTDFVEPRVLQALIDHGDAELTAATLRLTRAGQMRLNAILAALLPDAAAA
jgi:oxygen-independent coproporphyrinogen-3 oxidase